MRALAWIGAAVLLAPHLLIADGVWFLTLIAALTWCGTQALRCLTPQDDGPAGPDTAAGTPPAGPSSTRR